MSKNAIAVTTPEWIERFQRSTVATERQFGTTFRRRRPPLVTGGAADTCPPKNAIMQIIVMGKPTGGTFNVVVTVNGTTTTLAFDWNDDATAATTVLETHSEIGSGDVTLRGGPWPNATMVVEFTGALAATDIDLPYGSWSSLTGGTGVAVITSLAQRGSA